MQRNNKLPPIELPGKRLPTIGLPIVTSDTTRMTQMPLVQDMLAATNAGKEGSQGKRVRILGHNATVLPTSCNNVVASAATSSDKTNAASSTLKRPPSNSWPSKPDLAACCQHLAAFVATHAAKSSTNGENPVPTPGSIYEYMRILFFVLQLEPECSVYAYIYINRLLSGVGNPLRIRPGNWKKLVVGTCLLASKFVDDLSMKNSDFAKALNGWSLARINRLEFNILTALQWKIYVPISEYTTRYCELLDSSISSCN